MQLLNENFSISIPILIAFLPIVVWFVRLEALAKETKRRLNDHMISDESFHEQITDKVESLVKGEVKVLERLAKIETKLDILIEKTKSV